MQIKITQWYYTCFNGFPQVHSPVLIIIRATALETVRYSDLHSWRLLNFWNTASYQGQIRVRGSGLEPSAGANFSDKLDRWRHIRNRQGRLGMRLFVMHSPFLQLEQHFLPAARSSGVLTFWLFQSFRAYWDSSLNLRCLSPFAKRWPQIKGSQTD